MKFGATVIIIINYNGKLTFSFKLITIFVFLFFLFIRIVYINTKNGLENRLVKNAGFEIKHISTGKLIRSFTFNNFKAIVDTYKGIGDSKEIISEFKPDLIIGTGGYICGPVMLAARKLGIPYILHESNAFPGIAVKLLAKKASVVMLGFNEAKERLKRKDNLVYTGTPAKFNETIFERLRSSDFFNDLISSFN